MTVITCAICNNNYIKGQYLNIYLIMYFRFYYENTGVFTEAQRTALERVTLARVICENTKITEVSRNVFLGNQYPQDFVRCSNIPALDLRPWRRA